MKAFGVAACFVVVGVMTSPAATSTPVMILDGESAGRYHDWQRTTPVLKKILDETGVVAATVVTAPAAGSDFSAFSPDFSRFRAVVMNYDAPDERWPPALKTSFEQYVKNGGGLVVVHAADNAFPAWQAFNDMIGVGGWRGRDEHAGRFWFYRNGSLSSDSAAGAAGSHGRRVPFQVSLRDGSHPITRGLPKIWIHQGDELYARL